MRKLVFTEKRRYDSLIFRTDTRDYGYVNASGTQYRIRHFRFYDAAGETKFTTRGWIGYDRFWSIDIPGVEKVIRRGLYGYDDKVPEKALPCFAKREVFAIVEKNTYSEDEADIYIPFEILEATDGFEMTVEKNYRPETCITEIKDRVTTTFFTASWHREYIQDFAALRKRLVTALEAAEDKEAMKKICNDFVRCGAVY